MTLEQRITAFAKLGNYIASHPELLDAYIQRSSHHNAWFTPDNQWRMLRAIAEDYLAEDRLRDWLAGYASGEPASPSASSGQAAKTVGLVMAGNLPLVGFHDWLAVLITGHTAVVKLSEKDPYLLPHLAKKLEEIEPGFAGRTRFAERLKDFDAVIATGSDNTSRYFREYFGKYPHIIRSNRTSVAVLHGDESAEELAGIADDVFAFFGQGCRSVGKVFVPEGFVFEPFLDALHEYRALANHVKWKNNFDYNFALMSINREPFLMTGAMLLREDKALRSRLATLHYESYRDLADVAIDLHAMRDQIQAIVSARVIPGVKTVRPGAGQRPGLCDYADGIDTVAWLNGLTA